VNTTGLVGGFEKRQDVKIITSELRMNRMNRFFNSMLPILPGSNNFIKHSFNWLLFRQNDTILRRRVTRLRHGDRQVGPVPRR
jgi:hypothetical protein